MNNTERNGGFGATVQISQEPKSTKERKKWEGNREEEVKCEGGELTAARTVISRSRAIPIAISVGETGYGRKDPSPKSPRR